MFFFSDMLKIFFVPSNLIQNYIRMVILVSYICFKCPPPTKKGNNLKNSINFLLEIMLHFLPSNLTLIPKDSLSAHGRDQDSNPDLSHQS